jgi:hypothetical protein
MIIEIPVFSGGVYSKPCELFKDKVIGSVLCTGYSQIKGKECEYCISYKEENTYYLSILKEHTPIVSEVTCSRPIVSEVTCSRPITQLDLFTL